VLKQGTTRLTATSIATPAYGPDSQGSQEVPVSSRMNTLTIIVYVYTLYP
jgi:hypothetical protein